MAQTPQPPNRPAPGSAKPPLPPLRDPAEGKSPAIGGGHLAKQGEEKINPGAGYAQPIGVKGEPIEDGERDPDTVAEEQRRRSAEIEAMGVEAYKDSIDERTPEQRSERAAVEGVRQVEHHTEGSRK
jgi:hypothetical protein